MNKLLDEAGIKFSMSGEGDLVKDIKEQHAYVAADYEAEIKGTVMI